MKWIQEKGKWLVLFCLLMVLGTRITVPAASSLRIRLDHGSKSSWSEGIQYPDVTVNNSEQSPEWSKDEKKWVPGKKITGTIIVDGTYRKSDCTVQGGKLVSVKSKNDETTIIVSYVPVAKLETPKNAGWSDGAKTQASWRGVPYASKYQVVLYKEGGIRVTTQTTNATSMDLLPYMEGGNKYYYTVKAVLKDSSQSDYLKEGDEISSNDSAVQDLGDTSGSWSEYQNGKKYKDADGNYVVNQWKMVKGKWYYFNKEGFAVVGWQFAGDKWYYMGTDAQMMTGWQQLNDKWYYFNTDGSMVVGWIQAEPGKWYYLNSDGSLAVNTKVDDIYRVDDSGLWVP